MWKEIFMNLKGNEYFIAKKLHDFFFFLLLNISFDNEISTIYKQVITYQNKHDQKHNQNKIIEYYDITFHRDNIKQKEKYITIQQSLLEYLRLKTDLIQTYEGNRLYLYDWDIWWNSMNAKKWFKLSKKWNKYWLLFLVCYEITCRYWASLFWVSKDYITAALQDIEELEQRNDLDIIEYMKNMWWTSYIDYENDIKSAKSRWSRKYWSKRNTKYWIHREKIEKSRSIIFPLSQCYKLKANQKLEEYVIARKWKTTKNDVIFWSKEICWFWKIKAKNILSKSIKKWVLIDYDLLCRDFPDASIKQITKHKWLTRELNRKIENVEFPRLINSVIHVFMNNILQHKGNIGWDFSDSLYELCCYLSKDDHEKIIFNSLPWYKWDNSENKYNSEIFGSDLYWNLYSNNISHEKFIKLFLRHYRQKLLNFLNISTKNILQ